ncbi:uncharacterized protein LOC132554682 [Ylistrum balloti]|uniref:uncharacterized protein LOC132554682 n=1 Tax=Ylistrum balloti TaxID=509963 RepID=UPI0029059628|nr:uncharacterized protein LOC132554682 [Ylistrum balloti]
MSVLIAGHSQAKYFSQYLDREEDVSVVSQSGGRIENVWRNIRDVVCSYDIVVVHSGANNLIHGDSVECMLGKYQDLVERIWHVNPEVVVVLSAILPRGDNRFGDKLVRQDYIDRINRMAKEVNRALAYISSRYALLEFVGHREFMEKGVLNRSLLSRDGLHLSFSGTMSVVRSLLGCIRGVRMSGRFSSIWDVEEEGQESVVQESVVQESVVQVCDQECTDYRDVLLRPVEVEVSVQPEEFGIESQDWPALPGQESGMQQLGVVESGDQKVVCQEVVQASSSQESVSELGGPKVEGADSDDRKVVGAKSGDRKVVSAKSGGQKSVSKKSGGPKVVGAKSDDRKVVGGKSGVQELSNEKLSDEM